MAFFPLRLFARGLEAATGFAHGFLPQERHRARVRSAGVAPAFSYSGSGGPGAGISVRVPYLVGVGSKVNLAGTWSIKDQRRVRLRAVVGEDVSAVGLGLDAVHDYIPNARFYGLGNESERGNRSIFFMRENRADGSVFLGRDPNRRLRAIVGVSDFDIDGGYNDSPIAKDVFTPTEVPYLTLDSDEVSYGLGGELALLDQVANPSFGLHLRAEARRVEGLGGSATRYDRWQAEGRGYLPVFSKRRVIAARYAYHGVEDGGGTIPFYRMPDSYGQVRFAGYPPHRFRDRQLMLGHAEYRWIIAEGVWAFALAQLGAVAPSEKAFRLRDAHESYGGGLRVRVGKSTTARLEIAKGDEATQIYLDLKGDF